MSLKIGIVGLPNVGKSTLFNALTRTASAEAQNYPFCTIDPNIGIVQVPDHRLHKLSGISNSVNTIPAAIEFVDIAGLVEGASKGEGLGNKFLANIREVDAIAHVIRDFKDGNITHVHGDINPQFDKEIIESELILADLQTVEKRLERGEKEAKSGDKEKKIYVDLVRRVREALQSGILAIDIDLSPEERLMLKDLHLLTMKPSLYVINTHENEIGNIDLNRYLEALKTGDPNKIIPISAKIEEDLASFDEEEAKNYLKELGIEDTGLNTLIRSAYDTLGLLTYFTSGEKESRAWTVKKGSLAPQAAGAIHTDFEKGFIKAEVIPWESFVESGGEHKAKEKGLMRIEGKDYEVKDGDVMHFRFS
ncbi:redox-regulated ATPase YchF [Patescibacteria group bacterium]|nr:redox-regulated ATPase YchF [Patescibacteria group bacterium]